MNYFVFFERDLILNKDFSPLSQKDFDFFKEKNPKSFSFEEKQNELTQIKTLGTNKSGRHVAAADLIEAQRNLARYSLEKEFFDDLKKKLVIAGWN